MIQELQVRVVPEIAGQEEELKRYLSKNAKIPLSDIRHIEILNRSIDARQRTVIINLGVRIYVREDFARKPILLPEYPDVRNAEEILVIGAGPAGLFAALQLIESGLKPIIIERGKDVKNRPVDLRSINAHHIVNEDSNYCFGEGGAGTYSDGKLYTRSKKRGNVRRILELLVGFGASPEILIEAHPHIGTNKLPNIVRRIREVILERGGEVHFNQRVTDFLLEGDRIHGVVTKNGNRFKSNKVILATGHSARDIFTLLHLKGIEIELKPIAIGVRVEHKQSLIDSIQYRCGDRGPFLPPSPYSIVKQVEGRGVYSFCMCPGGVIAACATKPEEIVTNGWSSSRRARPTANSGIVVELRQEDFKSFAMHGPLAAMEFQKEVERSAWIAGGKTQAAPAQRLVDFVEGKISGDLPKTSYPPGIKSVDLKTVLPPLIYRTLQVGFREFDKSMRGYLTNEAVVHAPETRTSSPVSIPRDSESLQHIRIKGLYPCGEGAGYAGGIVSAAMDGIRCANAIAAESRL
ncbi:pyridine nucleotide-disulfide oxidoreductase [Leptospira broomii serovar Hurstbridge str. 5399]|uniref:Pyridine nucleotide-disulfide oxidoreductase n=1 Tax=Leptospira broomii serovar Hurstbridge str. 5399 TaxID=1049789 RepID=T0FFK5_9LEPT|nr:FAD-dependent oxidoreductase [Leptospira broomii]EQA46656.1 pyridine nucleotide-disulfide oxidoreductase [Leptospira broomii serovar Hurstbridge str. 5399]